MVFFLIVCRAVWHMLELMICNKKLLINLQGVLKNTESYNRNHLVAPHEKIETFYHDAIHDMVGADTYEKSPKITQFAGNPIASHCRKKS